MALVDIFDENPFILRIRFLTVIERSRKALPSLKIVRVEGGGAL
jgi:hypothetical protein